MLFNSENVATNSRLCYFVKDPILGKEAPLLVIGDCLLMNNPESDVLRGGLLSALHIV
jgi:hypothetical protein